MRSFYLKNHGRNLEAFSVKNEAPRHCYTREQWTESYTLFQRIENWKFTEIPYQFIIAN